MLVSLERQDADGAGALSIIAALLVTVPVWIVTYPPLLDYPGHLARMAILHDIESGGPMARFYELGSFLIPNVGMDAVILGLGRVLDVETACRLLLALNMVLTVLGTGFLARTLGGRGGIAPVLAGLLIYNQTLASGFVNYLSAVALLPWALALHIRLGGRSPALRLAAGVLSALALYFAHVVGFALYAVAVGGWELQRGFRSFRVDPRPVLVSWLVSTAPLALVVALFWLTSPTAHEAGSRIGYGGPPTLGGFLRWKVLMPFRQIASGNDVLDYISAVAVLGLVAMAAVAGRVRIARGMVLALVLMGGLAWVMPTEFFTARYIDTRMPVAILLVLVASLDVSFPRRRVGQAMVLSLLALVALRSVVLAKDWRDFDAIERQAAEAYRALPQGSILFATVGGDNPSRSWADAWRPPIYQLAALATVVDRVFVPAVWAHPAQQPIQVRGDFADIYQFQTPSALEMADGVALERFVGDIGALMARRREVGKDDFAGRTYLVLLFPDAIGARAISGAREIARGTRFALYELGSP